MSQITPATEHQIFLPHYWNKVLFDTVVVPKTVGGIIGSNGLILQ